MRVKADLHLHSTVSPCADLSMSPKNIVESAKRKGLSLIALTDHNCTRNCPAFFSLCEKNDLFCLGGAEVTTREECHVLCLFEDLPTIIDFGDYLEQHLPEMMNQPKIFGDQVYVNDREEVLGFVDRYLGNATTISFQDLCKHVKINKGLVIPAHVDRAVFGLISQLGFIPLEPKVDALEVYHAKMSAVSLGDHPYVILSSSDAHFPQQIGCVYNEMELSEFSLQSVKEALQKKNVWIHIDD
jgi:3',5'-nucleoside bisphosphate phosphatase